MSDYKNLDSKEKYGAYLNEEEIKAVEKILEIDQFVPIVRSIIGETNVSQSEIASFSVDYPNNKFFIYLTENDRRIQDVQNKLINSFPYPEMLEFKYVKYSHSELSNVTKKIEVGSKVEGSQITASLVDVVENKVRIGVYPYSEKADEYLKELYGDITIIEEKKPIEEQARTTPQFHVQGGLQIGSTVSRSTGSGYCTLGYTATRNGEDYLVTAGHCLRNAVDRGENNWYQGGEFIGTRSLYGANSNYDAGIIKLSTAKNATNYIYKNNSFDSKYTRETNGNSYTGQPVCISGVTSGTICGNVTNTNGNVIIERPDGSTYAATRVIADYGGVGGDSGAPVWYSGIMIGIHNASGGTFSHLFSYKQHLGIEAIVRY